MATPLTIPQGSTFTMRVTITDSGVPRDLTGYLAQMQLRQTYKHTTADINLTSSPPAGITITPLTGVIDIEISDEQASSLIHPSYVYDLEIENAAGKRYRVLEGSVTVTPEVTRP